MSTQKITPFLWFDNNAEEAMDFYVSIFKNAKVINKMHQGKGGPLLTATFQLEGQEFMVLNGGPMFSFTEAISLFVKCETQEEVDFFWNKLTADGGQESRCGWLKDKFGLSWQIIPDILGKLLGDKDQEKSGRAMQAMMKMKKIIIEDLQKADDNK